MHFYDYHPDKCRFREEVLQGLRRTPKAIPPKFFYDTRGSRLFDAITRLPEYYPTRTEIAILQQYGGEIGHLAGSGCTLIELGSGSSTKVRLLLDVLHPVAYVPVDISRQHLKHSANHLALAYPHIDVHAVCADYTQPLRLPDDVPEGRRIVFFPGSSIGNFEPDAALGLLRKIKGLAGKNGALLIGVDLVKNPDILHAAYNDAAGITERFNLNLLHRINHDLDADFDPARFSHKAFYNQQGSRVEMHLVSGQAQSVRINGDCFDFRENESIHTENSYKYRVDVFDAMAREAGFLTQHVWIDTDRLFSIHYLTA